MHGEVDRDGWDHIYFFYDGWPMQVGVRMALLVQHTWNDTILDLEFGWRLLQCPYPEDIGEQPLT